MPDWFERLTGFPEKSPSQVRSNLTVEGTRLHSEVNGQTFRCGTLRIPSLADLRAETGEAETSKAETAEGGALSGASLSLRQVVADVQDLHVDPANEGALFQVASQFNLLETAGPSVVPEDGVGRYERDQTQGPACAIAAGAGTIYRNYFAEVETHTGKVEGRAGQTDQVGQTAERQINCLEGVGAALGNEQEDLWRMENGYALASDAGLRRVGEQLRRMSATEKDRLRGRLQVGIQEETEVTLSRETALSEETAPPEAGHTVTQVYGSALPVAYSAAPIGLWAPFAKLVLEAAYEATLRAGIQNGKRSGGWTTYLTLLGGGAFGNRSEWIIGAIRRGLDACRECLLEWPLDVAIVSYGQPDPDVSRLVSDWNSGT
ncbi:hypothetical protein GGP65_003243 [Salinibacter ruber]|uniref:Macro domain-containing protein n=1 Tax=Salinibacter ruber TaxID=146919 RepID=A0AAW5PC35_9BACT|nr:hypothetical protein [Salinibacter ruber]MCS3665599.1 hypothetical protein [Salinibacter ruber]MCS4159303.1 hypothetical protein [Salinibacter ruber]MCS4223803.1 hypothetical protein [Salinibacter ruber]